MTGDPANHFRHGEHNSGRMVNELLTTEWDGRAVVGAIVGGYVARGADAAGWLVACGVAPGRVVS